MPPPEAVATIEPFACPAEALVVTACIMMFTPAHGSVPVVMVTVSSSVHPNEFLPLTT